MSKIIRSLDSPPDLVGNLDLGKTLVGPEPKARPAGGFSGHAAAVRQPRVSMAEAAEQEARRTIEEARREAEKIQREAWHAGFEQGEKAGERLALQKIQPAVDAFAKLIDSISNDRASLVRKHEQELIRIAFLIAAKVVQAEIDRNDETIAQTVQAALTKVTANQHVRVRVAPQDLQLIQNNLRTCAPAGWSEDRIAIEADETVHRGGCKVLTEAGTIDATIENQLRTLKENLWEEQS
ncbi:MAG: FliH/SctL family protein [Candidatus Sumerlaeia bacterium]